MLLSWVFGNPLYGVPLAVTGIALALILSPTRTISEKPGSSITSRTWSAIKNRIKTWAFLFNGRDMMHDAYKRVTTSSYLVDLR